MKNAPKLPSLPKMKSLSRCACGCDGLTQSRFVPGHDSKLYGMIKRIKAGVWSTAWAEVEGAPVDITAQLDAIAGWDGFGPSYAKASADAMGVKWTAAEWSDRLEAEADVEAAS